MISVLLQFATQGPLHLRKGREEGCLAKAPSLTFCKAWLQTQVANKNEQKFTHVKKGGGGDELNLWFPPTPRLSSLSHRERGGRWRETQTWTGKIHVTTKNTVKKTDPSLLLQSQSAGEEGWVWAICTYVPCGLYSGWASARRRNPQVLYSAAFGSPLNVLNRKVSGKILPLVYSLESGKFLWIHMCLENGVPTVPKQWRF